MNGKIYTFEVKGSGQFPYALLAEQVCFPKSNKDAKNAFENTYSSRTISLQSSRVPSVNLWKSYGWSVGGVLSSYIEKEDYNLYHTWPC
jgi:hypothetical protein